MGLYHVCVDRAHAVAPALGRKPPQICFHGFVQAERTDDCLRAMDRVESCLEPQNEGGFLARAQMSFKWLVLRRRALHGESPWTAQVYLQLWHPHFPQRAPLAGRKKGRHRLGLFQ